MKKQFTLSGLHCVSCSMLVEGALEDIGVEATCHYAKQVVDVSFDEKKVSEATIKKTIEELGYGCECGE